MTKNELIKAVSEATGHPVKVVREVYEGIMATIESALTRGEKVAIPPLGSLCVVERAAREGRHPKTGEKIAIPAKKAVKLRVSKKFKEKLSEREN